MMCLCVTLHRLPLPRVKRFDVQLLVQSCSTLLPAHRWCVFVVARHRNVFASLLIPYSCSCLAFRSDIRTTEDDALLRACSRCGRGRRANLCRKRIDRSLSSRSSSQQTVCWRGETSQTVLWTDALADGRLMVRWRLATLTQANAAATAIR